MVCARYLPFVGGTETHTREVSTRLTSMGHRVTVLTTDPTRQLDPLEDNDGVRVVRVPAWPRSRDYYYAPGVYKEIDRGHWDVMHCQGYHTLVAPLAMLASLRAGLPYVVSFHSGGHSSQVRNALRRFQWYALRPLLSRASRLVAVSRFEADLFQRSLHLPPDQFTVIPNGSQLPAVEVTPEGNPDKPLIVSVGRLERYKGHHRVITAFPHVLEAYPEAHLRILGTGPFEPQLRKLVSERGLAEYVTIRGIDPSDREGMARTLASASVVVALSAYESHGVAIMEAVALGRPALVSNTSALLELSERGLTRSIPLEASDEALAAAIIGELRDPITPSDSDLPSWDSCATQLHFLYCRAVATAWTAPQRPDSK